MTLNDHERPIRILAEKLRFTEPCAREHSNEIDPYYQQQKYRPMILVSINIR